MSFAKDDVRSSFLEGLEKAVDTITYLSKKLRLKNPINVQSFDDESYDKVQYSLPKCSQED